jgi:predicted HicB family RNase H-like nuclease
MIGLRLPTAWAEVLRAKADKAGLSLNEYATRELIRRLEKREGQGTRARKRRLAGD